MSDLIKHLNDAYPHGTSTDSIAEHFQERFGVIVKQEAPWFLFKYSQLDAKWDEPLAHECRGAILRRSPSGWTFCSRPFSKFFNMREGRCPIHDEKAFAAALPHLRLVEKADGTCIQMWHDGEEWRVSTLGRITTLQVQDDHRTFAELFRETAQIEEDGLDAGCTYLFELCCEENRIVNRYETNRAYLIGIRDNDTGALSGWSELAQVTAYTMANVDVPANFPAPFGVSQDSLEAWVEEMSGAEEFGEYPEGWVAYDVRGWRPVAKLKNSKYLALHHVGGGDIGHSKNRIVDAIFGGHFDDIAPVLTPRLSSFADSVIAKIKAMEDDAAHAGRSLARQTFADRKAYALAVQANAPKPIWGFFFQNAKHFMGELDEGDALEMFEGWLSKHHGKFDWKSDDTRDTEYMSHADDPNEST